MLSKKFCNFLVFSCEKTEMVIHSMLPPAPHETITTAIQNLSHHSTELWFFPIKDYFAKKLMNMNMAKNIKHK